MVCDFERAQKARLVKTDGRLLMSRNRKYIDHIRRTPGPFTDPDATSEEFLAQFEKFKVL